MPSSRPQSRRSAPPSPPFPAQAGGSYNIAHHGAAGEAPENTLAAIDLALDQDADFVEVEVQRTSDGKLVAFEDITLARTTNAEEVFPDRNPWFVSDFTLAELRQLDAGSWFGPEFAGQRIPTLREVIREVTYRDGLLIDITNPGIEADILEELSAGRWYSSSRSASAPSSSSRGTLTTSATGAATTTVTPTTSTAYRAVYPGGTRYLPVSSSNVTVTAIEAATIPVGSCATQADVDALPHGVGCHYTSVDAGVYVVGHDFLGNAWWNELPMQSYVQLTGERAGLYEVVDRVIAPGRASQLGPAEQWTCGDRCDVILQTCLGENTGFTWLRRVG